MPAREPAGAVLLMPGQLWFGVGAAGGAGATRVSTLLGSCVAITLWHPRRRIGGMCHYLLPARRRAAGVPPDGRYGDEAFGMLVDVIAQAGTDPRDYEAHLYGGADTLPDRAGARFDIGERNIEQGWTLIDRHGLQLVGVDVGDRVPRHVALDLQSGEVAMRRCAARDVVMPRLAHA